MASKFCGCGTVMVLIGKFYHCPKHGKEGKDYGQPRQRQAKYSGFSANIKGGYEDKVEKNLTRPSLRGIR